MRCDQLGRRAVEPGTNSTWSFTNVFALSDRALSLLCGLLHRLPKGLSGLTTYYTSYTICVVDFGHMEPLNTPQHRHFFKTTSASCCGLFIGTTGF